MEKRAVEQKALAVETPAVEDPSLQRNAKVIALSAVSKMGAPRAWRAIMDSRAWVTRASAAVVEDSEAAVLAAGAVDSMVVAEAGGNMTTRIFTSTMFALLAASAWAQAPAKPAAPSKPAPKVTQTMFDSPDAATQALIDAASKNDVATLKAVLGSSAKGILTSGDPKQDEAERKEFAQIATQKHHLEQSTMNAHVMVLLVGDQDWPFPIPLLHQGEKWRFDPERGSMEVRARQVGANELDAIQACAAYLGVQEAYAAKKRSAAGTAEFADTVAGSMGSSSD